MEILLWLAVPAGVTLIAMLWVGWKGRPRAAVRSDQRNKERFAAAMTSRRTTKPVLVASQRSEPTSGVAVRRPSRRRDDDR